ncbi:YqaJ viral recombinase family nuclease [Clostridium perfringens]
MCNEKLNWLIERQKGIGGSDVGAILGVNKWKTAFEVYIEKTEPITEVKEQSEAAYWGDMFEDVVAKEFEKRTGKKVRRDRRHFVHKEYPFMVANIDRRVVGENAVLECKTANQYLAQEWESEEVPASYLLQVQHYMAVTGAEKAYIAVLVGGQKFIFKEIERDEELIEMIVEACKTFWKMVEDRTPPALDGSSAAEKYLREKYSDSIKESLPLKAEIEKSVEQYLELKDQAKILNENIKEIENNLKHTLKKYEEGYTKKYNISWKQVVSSRVDSKVLKSKYPEIYKEVCKESKSRRFGIKEVI